VHRVNMSSISGVTGGSMGPDYGAAKAAIIGLTKYGRAAPGKGRHPVNAVAPGTIETSMIKNEYDKMEPEARKSAALQRSPSGGWAPRRKWRMSVVFLASDLASYITGETILVTGGRTS